MNSIKAWFAVLGQRKIELGLFLISLCSFGLFIKNSIIMSSGGAGMSGPIAILERGKIERKRTGSSAFEKIQPFAPLYNKDLVWTGVGSEAEVSLDDGGHLIIYEKSLVWLKRAQRGKKKIPTAEVLKGHVKLVDSPIFFLRSNLEVVNKSESETVSQQKKQEPEAKPSPEQSQQEKKIEVTDDKKEKGKPDPQAAAKSQKPNSEEKPVLVLVHPKPNTVFGVVKKKGPTVQVAFSWSLEQSGVLVVKTEKGAELARTVFKDKKFVYQDLKINDDYTWQILDSTGNPLSDLQKFKIKELDQKTFDKMMQSPDQNQTLEVLF